MYNTFNESNTRIVVGARHGFDVYSITNEGVELISTHVSRSCLSTARVVGESSLGITVGHAASATSRLVTLYALGSCAKTPGSGDEPSSLSNATQVVKYHCATNVLRVAANDARLCIFLEGECIIASLTDGRIIGDAPLQAIHPPNPLGIGALSPLVGTDTCYLAWPQAELMKPVTIGDVFLADAMTGEQFRVFPGDKTAVSAMCFNSQADLLAMACGGGTMVRVFTSPGARLKYTFRRGRWGSRIGGLAFSPSSDFFALTSSRGALHVFRCQDSSATEAYSVLRSSLDVDENEDEMEDEKTSFRSNFVAAMRHVVEGVVSSVVAGGDMVQRAALQPAKDTDLFAALQPLSTDVDASSFVVFGIRRSPDGVEHHLSLIHGVIPLDPTTAAVTHDGGGSTRHPASNETESMRAAASEKCRQFAHRVVLKRTTLVEADGRRLAVLGGSEWFELGQESIGGRNLALPPQMLA